jgi:hypothetical protein
LIWPADHTGWRLPVQTNDLGAGQGRNGTTITASANANQITIPVGATNGSAFFRLVYP